MLMSPSESYKPVVHLSKMIDIYFKRPEKQILSKEPLQKQVSVKWQGTVIPFETMQLALILLNHWLCKQI